MKVMLNDVRLSYPVLFKAREYKQGDGKPVFTANFILAPGSENEKAVRAGIAAAAQEEWPNDWQQVLKIAKEQDKLCLHNGDNKTADGYQGMLYVSCRGKARPIVIDRNKSALREEDGKIYPGCYVNAQIDVWAQNSKDWGKRVNASILVVQFSKDGDAFSAAEPGDLDAFPDLSEGTQQTPAEASPW